MVGLIVVLILGILLSICCCESQPLPPLENKLLKPTHCSFLKQKVLSKTLAVVHAISVRAVVDWVWRYILYFDRD